MLKLLNKQVERTEALQKALVQEGNIRAAKDKKAGELNTEIASLERECEHLRVQLAALTDRGPPPQSLGDTRNPTGSS